MVGTVLSATTSTKIDPLLLHTLALLDIKVKEPNVEAARLGKVVFDPPRFMTVNQALLQLIDCERIKGKGVIKPDQTRCVGLARVGREDQLIVAGTINEMLEVDFGAQSGELCG